ncbi:MAG: hypothetical protein LBL66_09715 [Clostridiales bacterium]|nr:hypothetical protein [Clostridiales bacterium]
MSDADARNNFYYAVCFLPADRLVLRKLDLNFSIFNFQFSISLSVPTFNFSIFFLTSQLKTTE